MGTTKVVEELIASNELIYKKAKKSSLKSIAINGIEFKIDVISARFEQAAQVIESLFMVDNDAMIRLIDDVIKDGLNGDTAMGFHMMMALTSIREKKRAKKLADQLCSDYPNDLLARCAVANYCFFD